MHLWLYAACTQHVFEGFQKVLMMLLTPLGQSMSLAGVAWQHIQRLPRFFESSLQIHWTCLQSQQFELQLFSGQSICNVIGTQLVESSRLLEPTHTAGERHKWPWWRPPHATDENPSVIGNSQSLSCMGQRALWEHHIGPKFRQLMATACVDLSQILGGNYWHFIQWTCREAVVVLPLQP